MFLLKSRSWVVILLNMAILWGARATSVEPMDINKLSVRAKTVIYGRVLSVHVDKNGWRTAQVQVLEQVRGFQVGSLVEVRLLQRGSRDEGWIERVSEAPELRVDEEVLLFLNWSAQLSAWVPIGLQQGKYRIVVDQWGARRALSSRDAPINQISDKEILNPSTKVSVTGLSSTVINKAPLLTKLISQVRGVGL